jgi:hypothetical protein
MSNYVDPTTAAIRNAWVEEGKEFPVDMALGRRTFVRVGNAVEERGTYWQSGESYVVHRYRVLDNDYIDYLSEEKIAVLERYPDAREVQGEDGTWDILTPQYRLSEGDDHVEAKDAWKDAAKSIRQNDEDAAVTLDETWAYVNSEEDKDPEGEEWQHGGEGRDAKVGILNAVGAVKELVEKMEAMDKVKALPVDLWAAVEKVKLYVQGPDKEPTS